MGAQISNRIAAVEKEILVKKTAPAECAGMISQLKVSFVFLFREVAQHDATFCIFLTFYHHLLCVLG